MKKTFLVLPLLVLVAACGREVAPVKTEYQPVYVNVPAPCPDKATGAELINGRPKPLADQPKPKDPSVRSALSQAQLGKYEAKGGWADKVVAALTRCQTQ